MRRCRDILAIEGTEVPEAELRHIVELNYPDVRQTINALQLRYANGSVNVAQWQAARSKLQRNCLAHQIATSASDVTTS